MGKILLEKVCLVDAIASISVRLEIISELIHCIYINGYEMYVQMKNACKKI